MPGTITPAKWVESQADSIFNFAAVSRSDRELAKDLVFCVFCGRFLAQTGMIGEEAGKPTADRRLSVQEELKILESSNEGGRSLP